MTTIADWDPAEFGRFRELRRRPAMDLLAQVPEVPHGPVIDLGCGDGSMGHALSNRFDQRRKLPTAQLFFRVIGVDSSPAMLAEAKQHGGYGKLVQADAAEWQPDSPPALIFSNSALQWVADHDRLMPRLAKMLTPGGVLAVQMPLQWNAPSHRFLRDIFASLFPDKPAQQTASPAHNATHYWQLLAPFGAVSAWETDYVQRFVARDAGHPVRHFMQSTAMRPYLAVLNKDEAQALCQAFDTALGAAYPLLDDGSALMPFRRVFFTLKT